VRVGTSVVTDPSMLITRQMEDHVGWVDSSEIKKKILKYQDKFDDYDMMN
jgi:U3 small nucleolar ribonucleoprotein protein IMP3